MDFRLPNLGEGIDSATVVTIKVKPGDAVTVGQDLLEVETDKANMPVTAEAAGTVESVTVKSGDKVNVGAVLLRLQGTPHSPSAVPAPSANNGTAPAPRPSAPAPTTAKGPHSESAEYSRVSFRLPALGEGIDGGTIISVKVKAGDAITSGQEFAEIETDKASMPVTVDVSGTVESVSVKPGDKVSVGAVMAVLMGAAQSAPHAPSAVPAWPSAPHAPAKPQSAPHAPSAAPTKPHSESAEHVKPGTKDHTPAGPATRRLARELGVALAEVKQPSGRGGRVTLDDVKGFVKTERQATKSGGGSFSGSVVNAFTLPPLPDFSKYGEIEKKPASGIRKKIAENLPVAWRTMPMVTQNDLADITDLEAGRKRIVETLPKGAAKITWTVLAVKACVAALKEFPNFNSSYDMNANEVILKKYFSIGIAVDTERGLVVPVIKDADKKTIRDIAAEVQTLAEKARTGKLVPDEMRGGTFTITNLGGIGGTSFTPIVNYPEVAILGMCRSSLQPVVKDGLIVPRLMLPLSLTYDHRVIDGADGARFTARLVQLFSDPMRLLMES